jgi:D-alanyl-lipoteichoic acid acyltransferase DltB (MBOAT superfamily)
MAQDIHKRRFYLALSLVSNLGVLAAFKYSAFFYNTGSSILSAVSGYEFNIMESLIIPAGLSFYTFQSLSYTIDVYRGKYQPNDTLYEFLLYVSFFPHMVAGPVVRYNSLMPQLKENRFFKNIQWQSFTQLAIWGYFKKMVIADNLNDIVTPVFNQVNLFNGLELFLAGLLFVIQVYCDFSGYSDIATGVAKLFGINLSLNYRRPLLSKSLHEFWQRNHISITTWFRDYLYIGLGGNRVSYNRWLLNIFLVFVISGFWHGANFTFIIWGLIHGVFYIGEILLKKLKPNYKAIPLFGHIYLILLHSISLIAFRSLSVTDLSFIYKQIFSIHELTIQNLLNLNDGFFNLLLTGLVLIWLIKEIQEEYNFISVRLQQWLKPTAYLLFLFLIFLFGNFSANTFIYFQF